MWNQLKKSPKYKKTEFSLEVFKEAIKSFYEKPQPNSRDLIVYTGKAGHQLIEDAMQESVAMTLLDSLFERKLVDQQQKEKITDMIKSPDRENLVLAREILEQIAKQDGTKS